MKIKRTVCALLVSVFIVGLVFPSYAAQHSRNIVNISSKAASKLIEEKKGDTQFIILDIRTPGEYKAGHIHKSMLIDYYSKDFVDKIKQLDRSKTYLLYCRSGGRSGRSLRLFQKLNFQKVYHLDSGIIGWKSEGLPLSK